MTTTTGVPWRVFPSSITGPSHLRSGLECQDRWAIAQSDSGAIGLIAADGAGSRSLSGHGAQIAVEIAREEFTSHFSTLPRSTGEMSRVLNTYFSAVLARFDQLVSVNAHHLASSLDDPQRPHASFATTLSIVALLPGPLLGYVGVGDSFVVTRHHGHGSHLVIGPDGTDEADNLTTFITSASRDERRSVKVILDDALTGIALCTDGVAPGTLVPKTNHSGVSHYEPAGGFETFFSYADRPNFDAETLTTTLTAGDFAKSSGDDKTMLLAVRRS